MLESGSVKPLQIRTVITGMRCEIITVYSDSEAVLKVLHVHYYIGRCNCDNDINGPCWFTNIYENDTRTFIIS